MRGGATVRDIASAVYLLRGRKDLPNLARGEESQLRSLESGSVPLSGSLKRQKERWIALFLLLSLRRGRIGGLDGG
jgi:hypothetical protein